MNHQFGSPSTGVIVTGGGSGIGLACAEALAEAGRPVALFGRTEAKVRDAATSIAERYAVAALGVAVDVGDAAALGPAVEQARAGIGPLGALVHSAGEVDTGSLEGMTPELWDQMLNVHARALPLLINLMMEDLAATPGSAVVAINSINSRLGHSVNPIYTAAKGAVLAMVRSLADSLAPQGIRINTVSPGQVRTPMLEPTLAAIGSAGFEKRIMLGRLGEPADIGRVVRFMLSDDASYVTAADLLVDGGNVVSQHL